MRLAFLLVAAATLSGCGGGSGVEVHVAPTSSLADEPVHIEVSGLTPRAKVTVRLTSRDAAGTTWSSDATFRATDGGRVDVDKAAATTGSYGGVWGGGLLATLKPRSGFASYRWPPGTHSTFIVRVKGAHGTTQTTFERRFAKRPLTRTRLTLAKDGVLGEYVAPRGARRQAAVLVFGGSEGGLQTTPLADALAARGYPALAIAYFRAPGLSADGYHVPLEYFAGALRWLARAPQVDPNRMFILGISRGSEAAQLVAVHFPGLVHGVVATVPNNTALKGSWTLQGHELPTDTVGFLDIPATTIPVERIHGPIFAVCGGGDTTWPSCTFADRIFDRLRARRHPYHDVLVSEPAANHSVGFLIPFGTYVLTYSSLDEQARERTWPQLLAFLRKESQ
jgi:dienelactone hydrolase